MVYIFGHDYSLTIVMPFFLILIMLLFFLVTYIRDNLDKFKIKLKKHRKKEIRIPTDFSKEFLKLKKQLPSFTTAESLDGLTILLKKYISEKLNINREFSFEELPRNKLDWQTIELTKRLSDLKYSGKEVTRPEVDHLIIYLSKIIKVKPVKEIKEKPRLFPKLIQLPKIQFKLPKRKHKIIPPIPHKPIKPLDLGLPKKITIDLSKLFKEPQLKSIPTPKPEHLKKPIYEIKKQTIKHIKETKHKKVKSRLHKFLKALSKEEHKIFNLEEKAIKKFLKNSVSLSNLIAKKESGEGQDTVESIRNFFSYFKVEHKLPYIPKPIIKKEPIKEPIKEIPKPHKIKHKKPSIFERIRINQQESKVLKLIKRAEKTRHPLIARKTYNQALLMYYKLPIEKEENISIRLNRYYEKVQGKHEKELLQIKHTNRKTTKEALKHLKKYRNYIVIEQNHFNNHLRKSINEVRRHAIAHLQKKKHHKGFEKKLKKFLLAISKKESKIFMIEEKALDILLKKAISLFKSVSRLEAHESYDVQQAIKNLFKHLKIEHKLPKYIEIKPRELPIPKIEPIQHYELKKEELKYPELKPIEKPIILEVPEEIKLPYVPIEKPIKIKPPEVKIKKKRIRIEPPKIHEKRISERMKKLIEEKEQVYNKLRNLENQELNRFRQTKRMTTHEDIGYLDYLSSLKPKSNTPEEQKIKKLFESKSRLESG